VPNYFKHQLGALKLNVQQNTPNEGFRPGQLGGIYAVLAHYSVQTEPAIVCLPTGYGKTSLMMALPLLMAPTRVLIVEPSDALRKQVASHFRELSTLRRIKVVPDDIVLPAVLRQEGRLRTAEEWRAIEPYDVVVSTPNSSSPATAPGSPVDFFDLIIFDEAHHAPADTWAAYLELYKGAKFLFLTATPFRRDGRVIPGKLVYRYPVMRAVQEGAFSRVHYRAVAVDNDLDDEAIDRAVAEAAVAQLRADREAGRDHRLFVRAVSITASRALVPLYQSLGLTVEAVDSRLSKKSQDECERRLISGELDGIICVDMFGEGYDFPKLKVAALHAPHRSLVPTIQFIGRFARMDPTTGEATLIAPHSRLQKESNALLHEGVELTRLIDEAAVAEILGDAAEQEILERLQLTRLSESDYEAVSPLALELYAHVRVFRCSLVPTFSRVGETVGRDLRVVKQWETEGGDISLLLTIDENPPSWATADVLLNIRHDAFLFVYFPDSQLCYIGSTRRTEKIYLGMMDKVCPGEFRQLSYEETSRARAGLDGVKFFNVGLKNTTFNSQSETYRTLTGPQAERAVTAGDSRAYVQGHFFGKGFVGEDAETIGASSSSRIWSNQRLSVGEFLEWAEKINARLSGAEGFAETNLDIIRAATTLRQLPGTVIAATWPKAAFKANPRVRHQPAPGQAFNYSSLTDWELCNFASNPADNELRFALCGETVTVQMRFRSAGGQMVSLIDPAEVIQVESATDSWMPLADWLSEHPPRFFAADKSSFEGVNALAANQIRAEMLAPGDVRSIDWTNCEVGMEFLIDDGTAPARARRAALAGRLTVQEHLEEHLLGFPSLLALFYDHRSGEAADYIAVTIEPDDRVLITLYHCKGAGGPPSGGRVGDVYEVAGQIIKSVYYCDIDTLQRHMRDRMALRFTTPSRFVRGDLDTVEQLFARIPKTKIEFAVVGVQPGISSAQVDAHLADLMSFGLSYARQGGATGAYWLVHD
jgi:superfamily II DNA or RNA helicase